MGSVRQVQCHVVPHRTVAGRCTVFLQTPLTASAERPDDGWLTYVKFLQGWGKPSAPTSRVIARIDRFTTRVKRVGGGLRRQLKGQPWTHDAVQVHGDHTVLWSRTWWQRRRMADWLNESTSLLTRTEGVSFAPPDLCAFLAGVRDSGDGVPLLDWLVEHAPEFAPYISSAGWLPKDEAEMVAVRKQRAADKRAADDAPMDFGDDEDGHEYGEEAEDRWR